MERISSECLAFRPTSCGGNFITCVARNSNLAPRRGEAENRSETERAERPARSTLSTLHYYALLALHVHFRVTVAAAAFFHSFLPASPAARPSPPPSLTQDQITNEFPGDRAGRCVPQYSPLPQFRQRPCEDLAKFSQPRADI